MTLLLDLMAPAVLGRLRGINRKHRLRAKHYADINDWPDAATFDVLDASELDKRDHFASTDALLVVSQKLKDVLAACAPEAKFFPANAGARVWVVPPPADDDVMYEADERAYARSGYQVTHATNLRVAEAPPSPWCRVRNTSVLALSDAVVAAASKAGVRWDPVATIADYRPHTPHPYVLVRPHGAHADAVELVGDWPAAPASVPHPLHDWVRDEKMRQPIDVDAAWSKLVHQTDVARAVIARYCSGLALPNLRATLGAVAKSKLKKQWKESTTAGSMSCKGLFVVASKWKDVLGPSCKYTPIELHDAALKQTHDGFFIVEPPVARFVDFARSDVAFLWSGMIDGYAGLHPLAQSYEATEPIVRQEGTNLILVHRDLAAKLDEAFYTTPLEERSFGLNLDDYWRVG